jgi:hypothetical protein
MAEAAAQPEQDVRVTTLELFFDLVFVFTLTQLTNVLVLHPNLRGLGSPAAASHSASPTWPSSSCTPCCSRARPPPRSWRRSSGSRRST